MADVTITAPNFQVATFQIEGSAPYVQHRFWKKADLIAAHTAGKKAAGKNKKEPRDFTKEFKEAQYLADEGWNGIPASCFRSAMISACRLVGFKMTHAKLSVFVDADGYDPDGTPLIKIEGTPEQNISAVRNATGVVDMRARPMWKKWGARVRVKFDADQFSLDDVSNLMMRVGEQVGIGEGRPDSKSSHGTGWGTFQLVAERKTRGKAA